MTAVLLLARTRLRAGWRGALVAVLIGIAGGAVLTAWAGARRTADAYERALDRSKSQDVLASAVYDFQRGQLPDISKLDHLSQVDITGQLVGIGMALYGRDGRPDPRLTINAVAPMSSAPRHTITAPERSAGRYPVAADEVTISPDAARLLQEHGFAGRVGTRFRATTYAFQDVATDPAHAFHPVDMKIVGIAQSPDVQLTGGDSARQAILSEKFGRAHIDQAGFRLFVGRLAPGYSEADFIRAARAALPDLNLGFQTRSQGVAQYDTLARPYVTALRLFALIVALASVLIVGQALVRQTQADADDAETLRAIGLPRTRLAQGAAARSICSIMMGTLLALVAATIASRWFPIGPGRLVTIGRSFHVDGPATGVFVAGSLVVLGAVVAAAAWRVTRVADRVSIAARRARALSDFPLPPPASTGVRRALADVGQDRPSVFATLGGVLAAAATVAAALTFAAGLDRFVTQPAQWGWHWDAVYDTFDNTLARDAVAAMLQAPEVRGLTVGVRGSVNVNGKTAEAYGLDARRGAVGAQVQEGRLPDDRSEVALAPRTMERFHTAVGRRIAVSAPDGREVIYRVVGQAVVPPSLNQDDLQRFGHGALLTVDGLHRVQPGAEPSFVLLDLSRGFDRFASLNREWSDFGGTLARVETPVEIRSYAQVRRTPLVLAGLLALLGLGVLAHALAVSVRSDQRQLGVLRSLGFLRRQVRSSILWQALVLLTLGGGVGLLLGIAAGRTLWHRFVSELGLSTVPTVPELRLAAAAAAAVAFAVALAFACAHRLLRTPAARTLRTE
jgi:hypothetical protein